MMRIALIGCGNVAPFYIKTLLRYGQLDLIGVMDQDEKRAARFSRYYSVFRYHSLDELLDDRRVELVLNLTNPRSHFEISKACLLAGKHVYSEKLHSPSSTETSSLCYSTVHRTVSMQSRRRRDERSTLLAYILILARQSIR